MENKTPKCIPNYNINPQFKAIYKALRHHDTFAAYLLPGEPLSKLRFMADIDDLEPISETSFSICPWDTDSSERVIIRDTICAADYLKRTNTEDGEIVPPDMLPCQKSTDKLNYKGQVLSIVTNLIENPPSKVVLSRVICDSLKYDDTANVWLQVTHEYFKDHKNTFRYIYYTPATGGWIGASPETLLSVDKPTGNAETVALAGTRLKRDSFKLWDEKNTNEQGMVVAFIIDTLSDMGIKFNVEPVDDVVFGSIKHKCDHFTFNIGEKKNPFEIIDRLNPTPALSGYPRPKAIATINYVELHKRNCYGGYVAVENNDSLKAFVNLRCAHFHNNKYCIYAGGGLTEDSKAEDEWKETENKVNNLKTLIAALDTVFSTIYGLRADN